MKYLNNLLLSFFDLVGKCIISERLYTSYGIKKLFKNAVDPITMNFSKTRYYCIDLFLKPNVRSILIIVSALLFGEHKITVKNNNITFKIISLKVAYGLICSYVTHIISSGVGEGLTFHYLMI